MEDTPFFTQENTGVVVVNRLKMFLWVHFCESFVVIFYYARKSFLKEIGLRLLCFKNTFTFFIGRSNFWNLPGWKSMIPCWGFYFPLFLFSSTTWPPRGDKETHPHHTVLHKLKNSAMAKCVYGWLVSQCTISTKLLKIDSLNFLVRTSLLVGS